MLKLHAHAQPNSSPALALPPPDVLSAVVETGIDKQDWSAAVEAALGLQAMQPLRAAEFIAQAVNSMHTSGSSVHVAAKGMPALHQAERHADVVKVVAHAKCCLTVFMSTCTANIILTSAYC